MTRRSISVACVLPILTMAAVAQPNLWREPAHQCTCADVIDLINRLNMAEAAVEVLKQEITKIEAAQRAAGRDFLMDERNDAGLSNYDQLKATITEAMGSVQMRGVKSSVGRTDAECRPSIVASSTQCLDEVVMGHEEEVHVAACSSERAAGKFTIVGRRPVATAVAYAQEEIRGYQWEIARIREILHTLPPDCQPGWVGRVSLYEKKTLAITNTLPPLGTRISGTENAETSFSRSARVLFLDIGGSLLNMEAGTIGTTNNTGSARTHCGGGLKGPVGPERIITTTSTSRSEVAALVEGSADVTFNFDPTTGDFALSLTVPESQGDGTTTSRLEVRGSCNPADDTPRSGAASIAGPLTGASAHVQGTVPPTATRVSGDQAFDWGPPVSVPNVTHTHTARMEWSLYKIR